MRIAAVLAICSGVMVGCSSQPDLQWHDAEGYRWAELHTGSFGGSGFKPLKSSRTNIQFRNDVQRALIEENRNYLNGSGVAAGDIDGDGLVDLYFARLDGPNTLYKNLGGFRFEDVTEAAGVAHEGYNATGATFADIDGDGHLDLLVTSLSTGNVLYMNDGQSRFTPKTDSGLGASNGAMTMALADVDGDGLLDLYITNYKVQTARDLFSPQELALENTVETVDGVVKVLPPFDAHYGIIETEGQSYRNEYGEEDELYVNRGNGVLERVDAARYFLDEDGSPIGLARDWGLTATFRDVTGDGRPDLYVANDFWTPDRFWINRGDGTFRAIDTHAIRSSSFASMGVDFSDIDRDGHLDFAVTEMLSQDHNMRMRQYSATLEEYEGRPQYNRNSLYLNRGDTTFAQIADFSGLPSSDWSWATSFMDVDLDGYEDLVIATGFAYDYQDMDTQIAMDKRDMGIRQQATDILQYPPLNLTNRIFQNNRDLTFTDKSQDWGFDVEDLSLGMALADLNNDGALDLIINRLNDEAAVYQNTTSAPRIAVRLNGEPPNTQGIGAKVELEGGPVVQSKEVFAGGNYLSGSQAQVVFAADESHPNHVLTVTWPGGKQSRIEGVQANRIYEIDEAAATEAVAAPAPEASRPLFEEVSDRIDHRHHEDAYDDFRFGPLLPQKLSHQGPGVAWLDVNRDGHDDLLITSGKGGALGLFENLGDGRFRPRALDPLTRTAPGDQTAILGWAEGEHVHLIVGSANYEQGNPNVPSGYRYTLGALGQAEADSLPGVLSTTGPLAAADYTGDGSVDLFVGGRFIPGQYPRNAQSRLFKNESGTFQLDEANARTFAEVGLVTGAVFTDFNQDGRQDLLISTEWGTLRLFENNQGVFRDITAEVGLDAYTGWWNGVATGDFTNDGLPDIIVTNLGTNSPYQVRAGQPLKMYYDTFNRDGRLHVVDAYYDEGRAAYVPRRKLHDFGPIPRLLRKAQSHAVFAEATVQELFDVDARTPAKEINTLEHMLFINTGEGFTARPLPPEAQFTAAFYAGVADFDNDGHEDLFLSQNLFALPPHVPRLDAGRGLVLTGDGTGRLTPVSGAGSGIKVYGEQRGAALSDFDGDGKVDLAVSQNGGETKLYLNRTGRAGLRVQLVGSEQNKTAIGSSIRLVYTDGTKGPRRDIQAGSGYWSHNSTTQVMGTSGEPRAIEVTWFDGTVETVEILKATDEYTIMYAEK